MKKDKVTKLNTAQSAAKRFGLGMTSPTVIVLLVMTAYPLLFTFFYSFTDYNLLKNLRKPALFHIILY
jgi:multiple sugar transport system permease protein